MSNGPGKYVSAIRHFRALGMIPVVVFLAALAATASAGVMSGSDYIGEKQRVRAPELDGGNGWLNTDEPLSLAGLRGKVVLLDFWTYGCVNCIHIIPDLKRLEEKYPDELVVIGVHSAKFDNEKETQNIRNIILRYGLEHPVVNDSDFAIWNAYSVNAWPTQVLIDPDGYIIGRVSGEGNYDVIDGAISDTIADFRKRGKLDEKPLKFALERAKVGDLPLAFPGKVLADEASGRLYISDSNHNRIVVTTLKGDLIETIGSGAPSAREGGFEEAGFNKPQGLALDGKDLFVADTGNHLIRKVDLKTKTVAAVAGTGSLQGFNGSGGKAVETPLRSPWDLQIVGKYLYIAMAGSHQVWRLDLEQGEIDPYAGSRWEARTDGPVKRAAFAQPSGLTSIGDQLFVADSESNIIRDIDLKKDEVKTLAGGNLFDFGDKDGKGDDVRLQHPLGVEAYGNSVLIADTYNDKIKILDPKTGSVSTFLGKGEEGQMDGLAPTFYEPGGLSIAGGKLYIADTNNHAVRVADLKTKTVSTLMIKGLKPPVRAAGEVSEGPSARFFGSEDVSVAPGGRVRVSVAVKLPAGFHLNPDAPQRIGVTGPGAEQLTVTKPDRLRTLPYAFEIRVPEKGNLTPAIEATLYYCREDNTGVCLIKKIRWELKIRVLQGAPEEGRVTLKADVGRDPTSP